MKNILWQIKKNKKVQIILAVVVLAAAVIVVGAIVFNGEEIVSDSGIAANDKNSSSDEPSYVRSIDGVLVPSGRDNYFPVAVMVENMVSSRPQAGLDRANLVYEALVEGGITRFMAIYASGDEIERIGPVRSARTYYLDWVKELDALYAHIGGSPESFQLIPQYDIRDLNQFYNSQYFWRSTERSAPHNLYTSSALLAFAARDKAIPEFGDYDMWKYSNSEDPSSGTGQTLTINFSSYSYQVKYVYDNKENVFVRHQADEPHKMDNGVTIKVKNVIVQFVKTRITDNENRLAIDTIGEGAAKIFMDGEETEATWKKPTREQRTKYYDSNGKEIVFNKGNTWVELVPSDRAVIFE